MLRLPSPIFYLCLSLILQSASAQNSVNVDVIPFRLTNYNNISIPALLNGKDTAFLMLHTAADAITLTAEASDKLKSVTYKEETGAIKSWGGQENTSRLSTNNLLQIGRLTWKNVFIWENQNSGQETDGKFGLNLFEDKVVALDFDSKLMTISANLPESIHNYEKRKLRFENNSLFIEADCHTGSSAFNGSFLIHTGYSGGLLLDDVLVEKHQLGAKLQSTGEKILKDSFGNIVKTKKAILPEFSIGQYKLTDVPAGFFEGAIGRQKMSVIGGDILKRFNIVIDAKREYIYLKTNSLANESYGS
jgi:hypothetical protein